MGLVDFAAHEEAGGELTDIWQVSNAAGSKTWPEWVDPRGYRVERTGPPGRKRITALVHPSGRRRERATIETEIDRRIAARRREAHEAGVALRNELIAEGIQRAAVMAHVTDPDPEPTDLRDLLGGPDAPLRLDDEGSSAAPVRRGSPPNLPLASRRLEDPEEAGDGAEGDSRDEPDVGGTVPIAPGE